MRCLDELEHLVEGSKTLPLTNKKMVEGQSLFVALQQLKTHIAPETEAGRCLRDLELSLTLNPTVLLTQLKIVDEDAFFALTQRLQTFLPNAVETPKTNVSAATISTPRLHRNDVLLLIVDVQERLMPAIHEAERVEKNCAVLAGVARQLNLPLVVTEQNPDKLGATLNAVREAAGFPTAISKMLFSSCVEETMRAIENSGRKTILLCGVESHVCVLQTALDLREKNYAVFAARDAISSRTPGNADIGWQRMTAAGVLPTSTESAIFEILREAGTPDFRALLPLLKG